MKNSLKTLIVAGSVVFFACGHGVTGESDGGGPSSSPLFGTWHQTRSQTLFMQKDSTAERDFGVNEGAVYTFTDEGLVARLVRKGGGVNTSR